MKWPSHQIFRDIMSDSNEKMQHGAMGNLGSALSSYNKTHDGSSSNDSSMLSLDEQGGRDRALTFGTALDMSLSAFLDHDHSANTSTTATFGLADKAVPDAPGSTILPAHPGTNYVSPMLAPQQGEYPTHVQATTTTTATAGPPAGGSSQLQSTRTRAQLIPNALSDNNAPPSQTSSGEDSSGFLNNGFMINSNARISHTPPSGGMATSYEAHHFGKRARAGVSLFACACIPRLFCSFLDVSP
jgi:hypothetical protein